MRKFTLTTSFVILITMVLHLPCSAEKIDNTRDFIELIKQDILIIFLQDHINAVVQEYYSSILTDKPIVYPYYVNILKIERLSEFRGYHFSVSLEVVPVIGPHNAVGKDRMIFEIAPTIPDKVELIEYTHLITYN